MKIKFIIICWGTFLIFSCQHKINHAPKNYLADTSIFKNGDLVFQDLDCGDLCDAIEKVTQSYHHKNLSHIGVVEVDDDKKIFVIEAYGDVKKTSIKNFLDRVKDENKNPKVIVGRLKNEYNFLIDSAVSYANQSIGIGYDDAFLPNNKKYYCSELVYECFKKANHDSDFFSLAPMTFNDPKTHLPMKTWIDYYEKLKIKIPEGELGINPGAISRSSKIEIVKEFY
jgi:Permuted papain-like amidase enzyme, YaeF/YiiX, C92 family